MEALPWISPVVSGTRTLAADPLSPVGCEVGPQRIRIALEPISSFKVVADSFTSHIVMLQNCRKIGKVSF